MIKNHIVERSRLHTIKQSDFKHFCDQTGLDFEEVERIFEIFDDKGGVLTRFQFKEVFERLHKNWLGQYDNCSAISDLVFRSFDRDHDMVLELKEYMTGISVLFLSKCEKRVKLEYVFDLFDSNHDGFLTLKDVEDGYRAIYQMLGNENVDIICKQMAEETLKDLGKPIRNSKTIQIKKAQRRIRTRRLWV